MQVDAGELRKKIRQLLVPFMQRMRAKKEIEGIVLLGGIANSPAKNRFDIHSDIDMAFFLNLPIVANGNIKPYILNHQHKVPKWLPEFQFYIGDKGLRPMEINVHQLIYSHEKKIEWNESKKEAYLNTSEIVFDRRGLIEKLIEVKTRLNLEDRKKRLTIIAGQLPWYTDINPPRQVERGKIVSAHTLLNESIELIVEALFLYNREYRPHKKWRLERSFQLEWTPRNYRKHLMEAMVVKNISRDEVERRRGLLKTIMASLLNRMTRDGIITTNPFYETSIYYDEDRQLLISTFADKMAEKIKKYNENADQQRVKDFVNYHLIDSYKDFKEKYHK